ncbi:ATP/GTP-binding protein [Prosthecobacter sp.]|uniref:ATP/GTP-binding protein n=1 Tax=Prosthecobacter sp. TaxID=1965333 RepID=UPI0037834AF7
MLKSLRIENFTVFPQAEFKFGKNLNIIIGENGSGKSHVLKAAYCAIAVSARGAKDSASDAPTKGYLATALADKLRNVFKPDELGRLARRRQGHTTCSLKYEFAPSKLDLELSFKTPSKKEVVIGRVPEAWGEKLPVFLPTRELLTISPGFVSLYETTHLPFEETWRDTCILLGAPLARGPREHRIKELLVPLEEAMGGSVELDKSGRFYLKVATGSMEMHLVAEGLRKLATVARLIATGSLLDKGCLFWDEPESNLNPRIIKTVARTILQIAASGIQVFIATHSLFLMRELHVLQKREFQKLDTRCFGLHIASDGAVSVEQGRTMDEVGSITALDEDVQQSQRYIDTEMGVPAE